MTSQSPRDLSELLRVSVVAGSSRVDLAVPPALPVAELVPGLARRLGLVSYDGLRLCTVTGSVLDDSAGLALQDVLDGAVLALAPPPPPPVVHDDAAEALSGAVLADAVLSGAVLSGAAAPPGSPRWPSVTAAALLLLLGALSLAVAGEARSAAAVALLLLAGALGPGRVTPTPAIVAAMGACGYAAVAAGVLASELSSGPGVVWAAAGGAALAVASIAIAGLPTQRLRLLPVLVVATAAAIVGAVLSLRSVPMAVLASVLLVLDVLFAAVLPWVAVGLISRPRGRVDLAVLAEEVRVAHDLLAGLAVGFAVVQAALAPVVARDGPGGIALAGCASVVILLRARHQPSTAAMPGLLAGGAGLLATAAVALGLHESWRPPGALVLAGAGAALLAAPWLSGRSLLVQPALHALETTALVALLPLLVVTSGALERWP